MSSLVPFSDARTLLLAAALVPADRICWPNEPFAVPSADPQASWLKVDCVGDVLVPIEVGATAWQESGVLFVDVMVPAKTGSDTARTLAKAVANAFRQLGPRNVVYRQASIGNRQEPDDEGVWWGLTVTVEWIYQDPGQ